MFSLFWGGRSVGNCQSSHAWQLCPEVWSHSKPLISQGSTEDRGRMEKRLAAGSM